MKKFECVENCSDCCGIIPFSPKLWEKFKHKARKEIKVYKFENEVFAVDKNMKCAFLKNNKCAIYDNRPKICRDYGLIEELPCPFIKSNGNKRSEAMTKRILRKTEKKFNDFMGKMEKRLGD